MDGPPIFAGDEARNVTAYVQQLVTVGDRTLVQGVVACPEDMCAESGPRLWGLTKGGRWERLPLRIDDGQITDVFAGRGRFLATVETGGDTAPDRLVASRDGRSWRQVGTLTAGAANDRVQIGETAAGFVLLDPDPELADGGVDPDIARWADVDDRLDAARAPGRRVAVDRGGRRCVDGPRLFVRGGTARGRLVGRGRDLGALRGLAVHRGRLLPRWRPARGDRCDRRRVRHGRARLDRHGARGDRAGSDRRVAHRPHRPGGCPLRVRLPRAPVHRLGRGRRARPGGRGCRGAGDRPTDRGPERLARADLAPCRDEWRAHARVRHRWQRAACDGGLRHRRGVGRSKRQGAVRPGARVLRPGSAVPGPDEARTQAWVARAAPAHDRVPRPARAARSRDDAARARAAAGPDLGQQLGGGLQRRGPLRRPAAATAGGSPDLERREPATAGS